MRKTVAERQKTYRERIKKNDPERYAKMLEHSREYSKTYKQTPESKLASYKKYKNSEKGRNNYIRSRLRRSYNMTLEDYQELFAAQGGVCKICGRPESSARRKLTLPLFVDHCHSSGRVRGLLCNKCNAAIGMLDESIDNLTSAISYLMENENF